MTVIPDTSPMPAVAVASFYIIGGTLPPDAVSYVERQADHDLLAGLLAGDYCYVLNSRQMGKSSLCVRTIQRLQQQGYRTCFLDLTKFGGKNLTAEQWYAALLSEAGRELGQRAEFLAYWKQNLHLGPMQRFFGALRDLALPQSDKPLVVFVDEIDVTLSLPFSTDEFFAGIRECYVERATQLDLNRLVFCLLGTATPADLIQDTRTSPFNIGRRIEVRDFTPEEARPLAEGLNHRGTETQRQEGRDRREEGRDSIQNPRGEALLARILYWTGGHPYLTQRLCRALAEHINQIDTRHPTPDARTVDRLCRELFLTHTAKESDDNLSFVRNRLLKSEADLASLLELYRKMRRGKRVPDDETNPLCGILKLSGVCKVDAGQLKVRNRIYEQVFDPAWVEQRLPDAERRRQKAAFWRGLLLASGIAGMVLIVVAYLGLLANRSYQFAVAELLFADSKAEEARKSADAANHYLYIANMNLVPQAWENHNVGQMLELLQQPPNYPDRGFEWFYWNRLCHLDLLTLKGHVSVIFSVAFSPDGARILTGSADGTAKVWDAQTGSELLTLKEHSGTINSVAFSPDGKRIVTGNGDGTTKVWDAATGKLLLTLTGHSGSVTPAVFTPDGIRSVAFSPDGKHILTGSDDTNAKLWDAQTGKELLTFNGHTNSVLSVAFSADSKRILTGSLDGTTKVWDAVSGKKLLTLDGYNFVNINSVVFSPDSKRILTSSLTGTAKMWDAVTGKLLLTLNGHTGSVHSVAFSPDGKWIVTGSQDKTVKIWDAQTGREIRTLRGHTEWISSVAFSPDGKKIVTGSADHTAKVWDAQIDQKTLTLTGHSGSINSVAFSPNGRRIVTGSTDKTAKVWDAVTGKQQLTLHGHTQPVSSVAFSPDGKHIVTGSFDKTAKIWNAATGKLLFTLKGHSAPIHSVAFSPNGKRILTGSYDTTAKEWDAVTGRELLTLQGYDGFIDSVAFSPEGKRIVTGSDNGTAKVWDAQTGSELLTLEGRTMWVNSIAFSLGGTRILTGNGVGTAKVFDAKIGMELLTLTGHSGPVTSAVFSPDGKRILTGSADGTAKIWEAQTGRELLTLKGHSSSINSVAFSPDGRRIVTGSADKTAKIWFADRAPSENGQAVNKGI